MRSHQELITICLIFEFRLNEILGTMTWSQVFKSSLELNVFAISLTPYIVAKKPVSRRGLFPQLQICKNRKSA